VIPLHKKGSKLDASNYRGISKLLAIPKLLENVITPHLQHLCTSCCYASSTTLVDDLGVLLDPKLKFSDHMTWFL